MICLHLTDVHFFRHLALGQRRAPRAALACELSSSSLSTSRIVFASMPVVHVLQSWAEQHLVWYRSSGTSQHSMHALGGRVVAGGGSGA